MNRWENSDYYLRTFSPLLQPALQRVARFDIPKTRFATLATIPVLALPAQNGYAYWPEKVLALRSGDPFTTSGIVQFQWLPVSGAAVAAIGTPAALFTTASPALPRPPGGAWLSAIYGVTNASFFDAASAAGSAALQIGSTANTTGVGSDVSLVLFYYIYPTYLGNVGGPSISITI